MSLPSKLLQGTAITKASAIVILALAWGSVASSDAAPRLTLQLAQSTLHSTLRRLSEHYGRSLIGPRGEGTESHRDDPNAARASFAWKDASLGVVLRDVAQAYRLSPRMEKDGGIRFTAGVKTPEGLTQRGELLSVTLHRVDQDETHTRVSGVPSVRTERSATLHLMLRTHAADADRFHSIRDAHAEDDRSRKWDLFDEVPAAGATASDPELPDERSVRLRMSGYPEGTRRLARVEGTVLLFRHVATHRFEIALSGPNLSPTESHGSLRFRATQLDAGMQRVGGAAVLGWPEGVEVILPEPGKAAGPVLCRARLRDRRLIPLETRVQPIAGVEGLAHGARLVVPSTPLPEQAVALVWDFTTRSQPDVEIPFRFEGVALPLTDLQTPNPTEYTGSLLIRLGRSISQQDGELAVGLAAKAGAGWGPTRWRTLEVIAGVPPRVESLSPGSYRVSLRFRRRGPDGRLGPPVPLKSSSPSILLQPNRATPVQGAP